MVAAEIRIKMELPHDFVFVCPRKFLIAFVALQEEQCPCQRNVL